EGPGIPGESGSGLGKVPPVWGRSVVYVSRARKTVLPRFTVWSVMRRTPRLGDAGGGACMVIWDIIVPRRILLVPYNSLWTCCPGAVAPALHDMLQHDQGMPYMEMRSISIRAGVWATTRKKFSAPSSVHQLARDA